MFIRRTLVILLVLIVALPFLMFRRANQPQTTNNEVQLSDLQLYQIRRGDVALTVSAIGSIEPDKQVSLSFLTGGQVVDMFVERDDYVLADDTLMRLDNATQEFAYEQALTSLELAEIRYEQLQTPDETAIEIAELAVESARGGYVSAVSAVNAADIEAARLSYEQAFARIEDLRIERDRIGGQFGGDSIEWTQANARLGEATFQAEIASLQLERLQTINYPQAAIALARIEESEAELERIQAGATQAELDSAAIQIEQAQLQVERAEETYAQTILQAPFAGVITAVNVQEGGLVAPSLSVIELTDVDPLRLTVQVDEIDIGLVDVGLPVRVVLDALPDIALPARVTSVAPLGTPSGGIVSYDVEINLTAQDQRVRVGMTAEANIIIDETQNVLVVPNLYIRRERQTGQFFVNILRDDNTLEEVEIEVGIQGRENSEVTSGLTEGDIIAIDLSGRGVNIFGGN